MVATVTRPAGRLAGPAAAATRRSRGPGWRVAVTLAALLVAAPTASGQQGSGRRLALVVGNDAYRAQSALRNAVNDARAVASALGELGSALSAFAGSLRGDDVALFYFAGHGVQMDGVNYLMQPPNRATPPRSSTSATCMRRVVGFQSFVASRRGDCVLHGQCG